MTRSLTIRRPRSVHHVPLAERILRDDRSDQPVDALRLALARPIDAAFARRLREAVLEAEVTERLRGL